MFVLTPTLNGGYVLRWQRRGRRLRPAVCILTYPHQAHPVTADHNHGESVGHCPGVQPVMPARNEATR